MISGEKDYYRPVFIFEEFRVATVRFGSVMVRAWNGSSGSGFSVPTVPLGKGSSVRHSTA